jgi:hypothetical protein
MPTRPLAAIHESHSGKTMVFWKRSSPKSTAAPARPARAAAAAPVVQRKPEEPVTPAVKDSIQVEAAPEKGGFDPYNSGAFDRRDTWGKVIRK